MPALKPPSTAHPPIMAGANKRNWRSCIAIGCIEYRFTLPLSIHPLAYGFTGTNANVDDNIFRWLLADRLQRACRICYIECKQIQLAAFDHCLYFIGQRGRNRMCFHCVDGAHGVQFQYASSVYHIYTWWLIVSEASWTPVEAKIKRE